MIPATPSTKQRVVIEYDSQFSDIAPSSYFTKTKETAMEIVRGHNNVNRAWFRGELIYSK